MSIGLLVCSFAKMQDVMARGEGPAAALPAIGVLLGLAAALTLISLRVFRWDDV